MNSDVDQRKINWYRPQIDREVFRSLNQRSDWKGMLQTLGHLGLLTLTGTGAFYAAAHLPLAGTTLDSIPPWNHVGIPPEWIP